MVLTTGSGFGRSNEDTRLTDGDWHLLCGILRNASDDMNEFEFWVDGENIGQDGTGSSTAVNTGTNTDTYIGAKDDGGNPQVGCMGMVSVFDRALTYAEINDIYNKQKDRIIRGNTNTDIDLTDANIAISTSQTVTASSYNVTASVPNKGVDASWINSDGDTVVVKSGIIVAVAK